MQHPLSLPHFYHGNRPLLSSEQSIQNIMFLALLRPICALKAKIAPTHWHWQLECVYFDSGLE